MIIDIRDSSDVQNACAAVETAKHEGRIVGVTSGCYDLFHNLHLTYLQRCRRHCDLLIVGIDSDDLVKQTKGPDRPIIPEHQRINLVHALKCVDLVFIMGTVEDFRLAVEIFQPKYIFKNQNIRPQDVVGSEHSTVMTIPDVFQPESTSGIIEEIKRAHSKAGAPSDIALGPDFSTPCATPSCKTLPPVNELDAATESIQS